MNEIICPNCNKAFKVDETGYADILKQVKDQKLGYPLNCNGWLASDSTNYICYVPRERNYSVMIYHIIKCHSHILQ